MIYQVHKLYKNPSLRSGKAINSIGLIRDGGVGVGSGFARRFPGLCWLGEDGVEVSAATLSSCLSGFPPPFSHSP